MNKYKIQATHAVDWHGIDEACVSISMGNPNLTGCKLAALLQWVSGNFKSAVIDVADSLNRHHLTHPGEDRMTAYRRSVTMGDQFLAENADLIAKNCTIPHRITRYDEWLHHPEYKETYREIVKTAGRRQVLRAALVADCKAYLLRKNVGRGDPNYDFLFKNCLAYQLDELAQQTLIARGYKNRGVMIYPAKSLQSMAVLRAGMVPDAPWGLEREIYVGVRFKSLSANDNHRATAQKQAENSA